LDLAECRWPAALVRNPKQARAAQNRRKPPAKAPKVGIRESAAGWLPYRRVKRTHFDHADKSTVCLFSIRYCGAERNSFLMMKNSSKVKSKKMTPICADFAFGWPVVDGLCSSRPVRWFSRTDVRILSSPSNAQKPQVSCGKKPPQRDLSYNRNNQSPAQKT